MFQRNLLLLLSALMCSVGTSFAADDVAQSYALPESLLFNGKPVPPYCFSQMDEQDVIFVNCDLMEGLQIMDDADAMHDDGRDGVVSASYRNVEFDSYGGFDHYKYLGSSNGLDYVLYVSSGGGSGVFSSVLGLKRDGDVLNIADVMGVGDRCNGGDTGTSKVTAEGVIVVTNITPYDLISLPYEDGTPYVEAYQEIDACAVCCVGEVSVLNGQIIQVDISEVYTTPSYSASQNPDGMQACLDKLIKAQQDQGQVSLSLDAVNAFVKKFETQCVMSKE